MKATLEFELPEDIDSYNICNMSNEMYSCLYRLDQEMRQRVKYECDFKTPVEVCEWVRDFISNNVDLDCVN